MEPRIQYAKTSDGVNIAYSMRGDGPRLLLVLSPQCSAIQGGWVGCDAFRTLAASLTLVEYDARGCGFSERTPRDFSLDKMVRDIEALVGQAKLDPVAVCALADGVPIAVAYAVARPKHVSQLVLMDGWSAASDFMQSAAWQADTAMREQDWTLYSQTVARVLAGLEGEIAERLSEAMRSSVEPDTLKALYAAMEGWDVSDLLPRVRSPALVVHNRSHPYQSSDAGRRLAAGIPGARLVEVDEPLGAARERLPGLIRAFMQVDEPAALEPAATASHSVRTILFTDLASSTALTQRLGDALAQELVRAHNAIVREALGAQGGTEIKHTGDGIMASFPTASGALECAVAIQRGVAERQDEQLLVHIGLNSGEPVAEEQDLFGTSVQLARRICDHAEAGQILASNVVRELSAGKGFLFTDRGEVLPKGFEEAVRLYEVRWREDGA